MLKAVRGYWGNGSLTTNHVRTGEFMRTLMARRNGERRLPLTVFPGSEGAIRAAAWENKVTKLRPAPVEIGSTSAHPHKNDDGFNAGLYVGDLYSLGVRRVIVDARDPAAKETVRVSLAQGLGVTYCIPSGRVPRDHLADLVPFLRSSAVVGIRETVNLPVTDDQHLEQLRDEAGYIRSWEQESGSQLAMMDRIRPVSLEEWAAERAAINQQAIMDRVTYVAKQALKHIAEQ